MLRYLKAFAFIASISITPAFAADTQVEDYKKELISLNRDIGTYYFVKDHFSKTLTDQNDIVIGSVQDFLINNQGEVQTLIGELNDMDLGSAQLTLAFQDISQTQDSYALAMQAGNMEEELANFLANIETAAGEDTEPLISARRLHGRHILLPTGESIGVVEQVVTDKNSEKILGVLIEGIETRPDYERFVLPYPNGLSIKNTGFNNDLELAEEYVEVIQKFTAEGVPN